MTFPRWWRRSATPSVESPTNADVALVDPMPRGPRPHRFLADLGLSDQTSGTWALSAGFMLGDTFYAQDEGKVRIHDTLRGLLDLGVSTRTVEDLSVAARATGLDGDDLFEVAADALSLARITAGMPDSFVEDLAGLDAGQSQVSANLLRSHTAAVEGDLVREYVNYLGSGWDPSTARMLLSQGLGSAGAQRIADQCPDGRTVVKGVWSLLVAAVDGDIPALRAWSWCTALVGMTSTSIREWHFVAGLRAPLLASAGVSLTEFHVSPDAFDDERLAMMAALRKGRVAA